ncbi:hypothetical protein BCR33DRAFT_716289 [Rhizoclosmatium globosum]|uniref:C2H2-type domain-containing protein n=1 Tax=Rhizoclosmatium globosum TaxID=329046 RepID=A0A1Y2CFQ9_9FUNG|nr:hypothetical protein BCR33DRAFT_716289 [Rhizoclosmatium globosum]|eukprot:ORY45644.1 hypothetical protein BCR33DRAFT_716289 [Rhizoclosmatium globosum]
MSHIGPGQVSDNHFNEDDPSTHQFLQSLLNQSLETSPLTQKENMSMAASLLQPAAHLSDSLFKTPLMMSGLNSSTGSPAPFGTAFTSPELMAFQQYHQQLVNNNTGLSVPGSELPSKKKRKYKYSTDSDAQVVVKIPTPSSEERETTADEPKARNYRCNVAGCGLDFLSKGHLIRHARIHNGERPYKCSLPDCHMTFPRSDTAIKHSRGHIQKLKQAGHVIPQELMSPKVTMVASAEMTVPLPVRPYRKKKSPVIYHEIPKNPSERSSTLRPAPTPSRGDISPLLGVSTSSTSPNEYKMPEMNVGMGEYMDNMNVDMLWNQWLSGNVNSNQASAASVAPLLMQFSGSQQYGGNLLDGGMMYQFGGVPMGAQVGVTAAGIDMSTFPVQGNWNLPAGLMSFESFALPSVNAGDFAANGAATKDDSPCRSTDGTITAEVTTSPELNGGSGDIYNFLSMDEGSGLLGNLDSVYKA